MYKELYQHYEYERKENDKLKKQTKQMLKDIQALDFEEIAEEMNIVFNAKMNRINNILAKYKKKQESDL
jgi:DNA-directed RNA polymerase specialized sigma24 family protein